MTSLFHNFENSWWKINRTKVVCWLKIMFKTYLQRNFQTISNKIYYAKGIRKNVVRGSWQNCHYGQLANFFEKFFSALYSPLLKVTKIQFKIICRIRVLEKNIPLWYIVPPSPHGVNTVNSRIINKKHYMTFVLAVLFLHFCNYLVHASLLILV